jgi:hypothetical protein
MMVICAPRATVMLLEDASTNQSFAALTIKDAPLNVTRRPEDVSPPFHLAMMATLARLTNTSLDLDVSTSLCARRPISAKSLLAILESALSPPSAVMMAMPALLTLVIAKLDSASTLQSLALAQLEVSLSAMPPLDFAK